LACISGFAQQDGGVPGGCSILHIPQIPKPGSTSKEFMMNDCEKTMPSLRVNPPATPMQTTQRFSVQRGTRGAPSRAVSFGSAAIVLILLLVCAPLMSQSSNVAAPAAGGDELSSRLTPPLDPYEKTVYDPVNHITWLADANLAATNRFGIPLCDWSGAEPCVNPSGSMTYASAVAWIAAMNKAKYQGSSEWQMPTTPPDDLHCPHKGSMGNRFGFGCIESAFGSLFYLSLGLKAPNTAVPVPSSSAGPFENFQPYLYWSDSFGTGGNSSFSFATGYQGANTQPNFLYVLPMIKGQILGAPPAKGTELVANPDGGTVYDPETNITWLADANVAAKNTMGLPRCVNSTDPEICVNRDGAMTWDSAQVFIALMNIANSGKGYQNEIDWQLPAIDPKCPRYDCSGEMNPMGNLFYSQLKRIAGEQVVPTPKTAVGPFNHVQPYLYWACENTKIDGKCEAAGPAPNFEWSLVRERL
jgi:hypothetical protein